MTYGRKFVCFLSLLLISASLLPILVVQTEKSDNQISTFGNPLSPNWLNVTVNEDSDFVIVDNADGFVFKFRKDTAGYNEIYQNSSLLIEDERWRLEYEFKSDIWRMIGEPQNISWTQPQSYHVIVKRFYTDFEGTTFNMTYDFYGGFRPKIIFESNIAQSDTYRIVWKITGINKTHFQNESSKHYVKFWNENDEGIVFDYSDVYENFGNITTIEIEEQANNHKLNEIFNIGFLNTGYFLLDPTFGEIREREGASHPLTDEIRGSKHLCPENNVIAQSMSMFLISYTPNKKVKAMLYKASDLSFVCETEEKDIGNVNWDWEVFVFAEPKPILQNIEYWLVGFAEDISVIALSYFAGAGANGIDGLVDYEPYNGYPDPLEPTDYFDDVSYCLYVTYGTIPEEDYVDNNTSDVDSSEDIGTHSNFENEKACDLAYDTLIEENKGESDTEQWLSPNNYLDPNSAWTLETNAYDEDTVTKASSTWMGISWSKYLYLNFTQVTGTKIRYFVSRSSTNIVYVGIEILNITDSIWYYIGDAGTIWNAWKNITFTSTTSNCMRIRFYNNGRVQSAYVHEMDFLNVTAGTPNYKLDLEIQWTNANYTRQYEDLSITTGTFSGSEDLMVYAWNVSTSDWHFLYNLTENSQNNVSVIEWLHTATFTVRFLGGLESEDTVQDSWEIGCALLHTYETEITVFSSIIIWFLLVLTVVFLSPLFIIAYKIIRR